jgi:hypothetical protein
MIATHRSSEMSIPIAVSFTDTFASSFRSLMRSRILRYSRCASRASRSFVVLSPRRSREALIPFRFRVATASSASSIVSPATKRPAKPLARELWRMKSNTRC